MCLIWGWVPLILNKIIYTYICVILQFALNSLRTLKNCDISLPWLRLVYDESWQSSRFSSPFRQACWNMYIVQLQIWYDAILHWALATSLQKSAQKDFQSRNWRRRWPMMIMLCSTSYSTFLVKFRQHDRGGSFDQMLNLSDSPQPSLDQYWIGYIIHFIF